MNEAVKKRNELLAQKVIKGLKGRNMAGFYAANKEEALKLALELIEEETTVGWGGSTTVEEIGLKEALINGNYQVINRDLAKDAKEKRTLELAVLGASSMVAGSNAITEDGELVNIDGNGNRVAGIIYGPEQVILIIGMNKVCKTLEDAISRAQNMAATTNTKRFAIQTPCNVTGSCAKCKTPETICCQYVVTRYSKIKDRIKVILVNENLGF